MKKESPNNALYTLCQFNHRVVKACIDTALNETTISKCLVDEALGMQLKDGDCTIIDLNFSEFNTPSAVTDSSGLLNTVKVTARVTDNLSAWDLHLGLSFLLDHKCQIDLKNWSLTLNGERQVKVALTKDGDPRMPASSLLRRTRPVSSVRRSVRSRVLEQTTDEDHRDESAESADPVEGAESSYHTGDSDYGGAEQSTPPSVSNAEEVDDVYEPTTSESAADSMEVLDFGDAYDFDSLEEAQTHIQEFINAGPYTYVSDRAPKNFEKMHAGCHRIQFRSKSLCTRIKVESSHIPFKNLGCMYYWCGLGKRQYRAQVRSRKHEQNTLETSSTKNWCKAAITVRSCAFYPEFKIPQVTHFYKARASKRIREAEKLGSVKVHRKFLVQYPSEDDHANHVKGEMAGLKNATHPEIMKTLRERMAEGVNSLSEMQRWLKHFVTEIMFAGREPPPPTNSRFWPSKHRIGIFMSRYRKENGWPLKTLGRASRTPRTGDRQGALAVRKKPRRRSDGRQSAVQGQSPVDGGNGGMHSTVQMTDTSKEEALRVEAMRTEAVRTEIIRTETNHLPAQFYLPEAVVVQDPNPTNVYYYMSGAQ